MKKLTVCLALTCLIVAVAVLSGCGGIKTKTGSQKKSVVDSAATNKVQVGDIEMAYKTIGEGYPLVMIMGFSGTMDLWDPRFVEKLSSKYKVIVFDNRGMGETTAGSKEFTIEQFADDTAGLMKALGINKAYVLGWSMGGDVALQFVVSHKEMVNKLVVYAGDCGGTQRVMTPEVTREITEMADPSTPPQAAFKVLFPEEWMKAHPNFYKTFPVPKETSSPESVKRQGQAYLSWDGVYDRLPEVKSPTLIATGTEDISTPTGNAMILVERIPGSWLVRYKGAGHGLMYQYPDDFAKTILDFLGRSEGKGS